MTDYNFQDFTEESYKEILLLAKANYRFINYEECEQAGKCVLWRHDIDLSVHRAYKLASIEKTCEVQTTYFLYLHSHFYNALEDTVAHLIKKIRDMGHSIGLHFDPSFYPGCLSNFSKLEYYLALEKNIIENIFQTECKAFSYHNPDTNSCLEHDQTLIAGMFNTYSKYLRSHYGYCSDSNGYWRFDRLHDVLRSGHYEKLQVLTHPGWWTPEAMSPRDRITRCIEGRSHNLHRFYDTSIERHGRENVR